MKHTTHLTIFLAVLLLAVVSSGCAKKDNVDGDPFAGDPFASQIEGLTHNSFAIRITPKEVQQDYVPLSSTKSEYLNAYQGDVTKFLENHINTICITDDCTPQEAIAKIKRSGESLFDAQSLAPGVTYVFCLIGVDTNGKPTTKATTIELTTEMLPQVDCQFKFSFSDITITQATVTITPSNHDLFYVHQVVEADKYPTEPAAQHEFIQLQINKAIAAIAKDKKMSFLDAVHALRLIGTEKVVHKIGSFLPDKRYLAVATCVDKSGYVRSDIASAPFTTAPPKKSANVLNVTTNALINGCEIHVETANSDPYYVDLVLSSTLEGKSDEQIISKYIAAEVNTRTRVGTQSIDTWENRLVHSAEYTVLAFGCNEWATTPLQRIPIKTKPGGNPALCTFEITFTSDAMEGVIIYHVIPSDKTVNYVVNIVSSPDYMGDAATIAKFEKDLKNSINENPSIPMPDVVASSYSHGDKLNNMYLLTDNNSHIVYAFGIDPFTGKVVTRVFKQVYENTAQ